MESIEFLKQKNLLNEDSKTFKIIKDDDEIILNDLLDEYHEMKNKDEYLRLYADFENFKKRAFKEKQEAISKTKIETLSSILDIDNDIFFAKKSIKDSEGLDIITNKISKFLESNGIIEIQTDIYDPDIHEVVSIVEIGEEKIIDVVSKGYTLNGKIFRYPKIIVGK